MVCSLSFSFELGSLRLTLFQGKDFNFKSADEAMAELRTKNASLGAHRHSHRIMKSSLVAQSLADPSSRLTQHSAMT